MQPFDRSQNVEAVSKPEYHHCIAHRRKSQAVHFVFSDENEARVQVQARELLDRCADIGQAGQSRHLPEELRQMREAH